MAMPLGYAIKTSLRKYRRKKLRLFFGIVPTIFLLILVVLISGLGISADYFLKNRILAKIEHREEVIELNRSNNFTGSPAETDSASDAADPNAYNQDDIKKIIGVSHIATVQPERPLPSTLATTTDLVPGSELVFSGLTGAPEEVARLYNATDFTYKPGAPIPLVISRSTFGVRKIDFGGKTELKQSSADFSDPAKMAATNPLQSRFLADAYDKTKLKGQVFSVTFGGLPRVPHYSQESKTTPKGEYYSTFRPLTPSAIAKLKQDQKDKISPFWNYDQLQKGITVKFQIVGYNDSLDDSTQFVPSAAAGAIAQQLYDVQRLARTKKALSDDDYKTTFAGWKLTKDGQVVDGQPNQSADLFPAQLLGDQSPQGLPGNIAIPGWLYRYQTKGDATVPSDVSPFVFKSESLPIKSLAITVDNAANREAVEKALTSAGFPEAGGGLGFTNALRQVRLGFDNALIWIVGILAGINALILIAAVSRSVSDAQREIGVYRALGARRRDIRLLYVVFASLQTTLGVALGIALGILAIFPVASWLVKVIGGFTGGAGAGEAFGLDLSLHAADLYHIDIPRVIAYGLAVILLTVVVSLIPAARAARISPVEAIRRSE